MARRGYKSSRNTRRNTRSMATGGSMTNSCPPGTHMMSDGSCMSNNDPSMNSGGYRRGGSVRRPNRTRRMQTGGHTHSTPIHDHMMPDFNSYSNSTDSFTDFSRRTMPQWVGIPGDHQGWGTMDEILPNSGFSNTTETTHQHPRRISRRTTSARRMEHGGSHCGDGMSYQNGGCVRMETGGLYRGSGDTERQTRKR